jgi:hypothetical protein
MKSKRIFISHAAKDNLLADALVDLLETGTSISSDDIFCSSLEGLDIPSGQNFITYIRDQIQQPDVVILLLTENYFASQFCLCELGAAWAMSHNALPLLVPPLAYADVKGVLLSTQVDKIDSDSDLDRFYESLSNQLVLSSTKVARWGAKKRQFLKNLPGIVATLEKPTTVNPKDFEALKAKYDTCLATQDEYEDELSGLKSLVKDLESCKDANEVKKVKRSNLSGMDALVSELNTFKQALRGLPPIAVYVMFRTFTGVLSKFDPWTEKLANDDAGSATEDGYLHYDDGFELNEDDPRVKKALSSLNRLEKYIGTKVDENVSSAFEEESEFQLALSNRRLWKNSFCDQISKYFA